MRRLCSVFRQSRPSSCMYCGIWIKCDMYRHVARFHLDLAQLWRCPESWCTIWKGTPQDCMDHIRGANDVPWEIKSASLEQYLPLWTVTRKVWSGSLTAQHSGVSTNVLLFSDIHLSVGGTIIGSTSEVSHISHFGEITCLSCVRCCRCRWSSLRMEWLRRTPPARVLLHPGESSGSRG